MRLFVLWFILLVACVLLFSCTAPKPIVHTEYRDVYKTDTVQVLDSVYKYRIVFVAGDTIYIHDSIDRWRLKDRVVKELIHDSVEVEVIKNKPRTGFEKAVYCSGYILWGLIVIGIIIGIIKLLIRLHIL